MLDALKVFKSDNVDILLNNDVKPIILKSKEDDSLIELILPIKTY
jgi:DNA polymerase-3 subunit beta